MDLDRVPDQIVPIKTSPGSIRIRFTWVFISQYSLVFWLCSKPSQTNLAPIEMSGGQLSDLMRISPR